MTDRSETQIKVIFLEELFGRVDHLTSLLNSIFEGELWDPRHAAG